MKNMIIVRTERIRSITDNANPRYRVFFSNGAMMATSKDSAVNYHITNSDYHNVPLTVTTNQYNEIIAVDKEA